MEDYFENIFGGFFNTPKAPVARQVVQDMAPHQMKQTPATTQGPQFFNIPGLFGINNQGFTTNMNQQPTNMQNAISSVYNLDTGRMRTPQGIFTGTDAKETAGLFDNMSGAETIGLLSNVASLLEPIEQEPLRPMSVPTASAGLRLPEIDLMQYYKGIL